MQQVAQVSIGAGTANLRAVYTSNARLVSPRYLGIKLHEGSSSIFTSGIFSALEGQKRARLVAL